MSFQLTILKLPAAAKLNQRSLVLVDKDYFIIGRGDDADLVLPDEYNLISRKHFSLEKRGTDWLLTVLSTVNAVQIGDREVQCNEKHMLVEGENILLGTYELVFERATDNSKTQFAPVDTTKNIDPFAGFSQNTTSAPNENDPFGFLGQIEPVSTSPNSLPLSGVLDIFGIDVPNDIDPSTPVIDFGGTPNNPEPKTDPFEFMNNNLVSQSSAEQAVVVDVFGLDNPQQSKPITNGNPLSSGHIHPIHESMPMPITEGFDSPILPSLTNTDTKKLLIEALGLDYERFATIDEKELIQRVGFLLSNSLTLIVDLLRLRSATKVEVGTAATTLTVNHNNPLKYSPNSVVALGYLLGKQQIGFMSYQEAVKSTREDLVSYNKDLLNVTQKLGKHILQELSPVIIEKNLDAKGGFSLKIPVQREAKLWTEYKKIHESCGANLDQIIKKVF